MNVACLSGKHVLLGCSNQVAISDCQSLCINNSCVCALFIIIAAVVEPTGE
jgi:Flp pilus assembly protein protease CpaA